ncbi:hypothetical protein BT96DRAFT_43836 [Gymnopus androsaceus JB14]|uniref:Endo-1,3(4)-beta-glucanase 1 carbohydrate binding domain-containing protein n=1 Tax=Gymnopus androsaceus JB14 TaxID=1447944 RepID=A0A6A4HH69_9AGAR|nr:hypothetical protein BT96DRAFT_43836 [Gymnopus androsaceus JB14]
MSCGSSMYFPSQYTCFDDNFLCPILNGNIYIACGDTCYSTTQYSCSNTTLEVFPQSGPETTEACGSVQFYPSQYVCLDGDFLCPFMDGNATLRCGAACYAPSQYSCSNGELSPINPPPPSLPPCVTVDQPSQVCIPDGGCNILTCCPGLISIADKCRNPCDVVPTACSTTQFANQTAR